MDRSGFRSVGGGAVAQRPYACHRGRPQRQARRPRQPYARHSWRFIISLSGLAVIILAAAVAAAIVATDRRAPSRLPLAILTNPGFSIGGVSAVAFSPDGSTLASGDSNGRSYTWNVASRRLSVTLTDPGSQGVASVAFSPDGTTLANGDADGSIDLWNIVTGRQVGTMTDPSGLTGSGVSSLAYSPDGRTLATGDGNGSSYIWNTATASQVATLADPFATSAGVSSV